MENLFGIGSTGLNYTGAQSVSVTIVPSDWSNLTCTKTISGVTSTIGIIVSPANDSIDTCEEYNVKCTGQGTDSLTFTCSSVPSSNVIMNVLMVAVMVES